MGTILKSILPQIYDRFLLLIISIINHDWNKARGEVTPQITTSPKRPRLLIVLGINEEIIQDFVTEIIQDMLSQEYDLEFISVDWGDFVYEISQHRKVDLYVFLLNNLWYLTDSFSGETNAERSISLIRALKSESETPIIAFSGVANAVSRALPAGANHSLGIPFSVAEIMQCIKSSLRLSNEVN